MNGPNGKYSLEERLKRGRNKLYAFEDRAKNVVLHPRVLCIFLLIVVTVLAVYVRLLCRDYRSGDYNSFLSKWFDVLKENGGFSALRLSLGDYNAPYLTILAFLTYLPFDSLYSIKFVSCVFDFVLAVFAGLLTREFLKDRNAEHANGYACVAYAIVLFLPTVFLNSGLWAQCDSIYVSFLLISLFCLKKNKIVFSFISLGAAFAFKLQFVFILPVYVILYFRKKEIRLWHFLLIFLTDVVLCLPAVFAGRSLGDCLFVYLRQIGEYSGRLTLNYPNFYAFVGKFFEDETTMLSIFAITLVGITVFLTLYRRKEVEKDVLRYALAFALLMVNVLPCMHERYGYFMEVLSVVYVLQSGRDRYLPVVLQLCNLSGYANFLASGALAWGNNYFMLAAIAQTIAVAKFIYDTLKNDASAPLKVRREEE